MSIVRNLLACSVVALIAGLGAEPLVGQDPDTAALGRQCDRGDLVRCVELGDWHAIGWTDVGIARAVALFRKACEGGVGRGCQRLGDVVGEDRATEIAYRQAVRLYETGCRAGEVEQCTLLSQFYQDGGDQEDLSLAISWGERACETVSGEGCDALAMAHERVAIEERVAADRALREAGAAEYRPQECAGLSRAECQEYGERRAQASRESFAAAAAAFVRSARGYDDDCEGGDAAACYEVALLYWGGHGVERDDRVAAEYHRRACQAGHRVDCVIDADVWEGMTSPSEEFTIENCRFEPTGSTYRIGGVRARGGVACSTLPRRYAGDSVAIDATFRMLEGDSRGIVGAGIQFGLDEVESHFDVTLGVDGTIWMSQVVRRPGQSPLVRNYGVSAADKPAVRTGYGQVNRLTLELRGREARLMVNGMEVITPSLQIAPIPNVQLLAVGGTAEFLSLEVVPLTQ